MDLASATVGITAGLVDGGAEWLAAMTAGTNITAITTAPRDSDLERHRHSGRLPASIADRDLRRHAGQRRERGQPGPGVHGHRCQQRDGDRRKPLAVMAPLAGDANLDGTVDIRDLNILLAIGAKPV